MARYFVWILIISLLPFGCARHRRVDRDGIMSDALPITLDDLSEIRAGEENHQKVMWEYKQYHNPRMQTFLNEIAANIAEVSTRPHLPYKVILLDDEDVNVFGGAGGYIYITRGLLNFVESESEIAGVIAHEIGHIAHYDYSVVPQQSKMKYVYEKMLQGSELAKDSIGTYGTAFNYGMKGIGKAAPHIAKRFGADAEIVADEKAMEFMIAANYDPRAYQKFVEKLSRVEMADVGRFVILMNTHPPFPDRRALMNDRMGGINFDSGSIDFKKDTLGEVRQVAVTPPSSILFVPQLGVSNTNPIRIDEFNKDKDSTFAVIEKKTV